LIIIRQQTPENDFPVSENLLQAPENLLQASEKLFPASQNVFGNPENPFGSAENAIRAPENGLQVPEIFRLYYYIPEKLPLHVFCGVFYGCFVRLPPPPVFGLVFFNLLIFRRCFVYCRIYHWDIVFFYGGKGNPQVIASQSYGSNSFFKKVLPERFSPAAAAAAVFTAEAHKIT
jgi:hypothetical protein